MTESIDPTTSIRDAGAMLRAGRLSAPALAEQCLERIEHMEPKLNAFITVTSDLAREQAREAGREAGAGRWRSGVHGIPVAVKDFYDTNGIRTTAAFEGFERRVPSQDAVLVERLREAGAVLVGKTNMHKLGMGTTSLDSHFGPVVNPRSAMHVAGGSSGGSAAAVAAGLCFFTIDTDAVGSGRLPAAICGVVCHKPTFGRLSAEGILAGEKANPAIALLSHPCVTARSAEDVGLVLEALGAQAADAAPRQRAIRRIGIVGNYTATDEVRSAFDDAISSLAATGVKAVVAKVPFHAASFDVRGIDRARAGVNATLFADVDALVLPTLAAATPTVEAARAAGDMAVDSANTFFANYFGLPAITVPAGVDRQGLPLAVQFVGPAGSDDAIVSLAAAFERTSGWHYTPPTSD